MARIRPIVLVRCSLFEHPKVEIAENDFDDDALKKIEMMLEDNTHNKDKDLIEILKAEDNSFEVIDVLKNSDNLDGCMSILAHHNVTNGEGLITCSVKILALKSSATECLTPFYAILIDQWVALPAEKGDSLQVFGKIEEPTNSILISDSKINPNAYLFDVNFVILEPSLHLYPTLITAAFPCYRRAVLQTLFSQREDTNIHQIMGLMMHDLWEKVLCSGSKLTYKDAEKLIQTLVQERLEALYYLKKKPETIIQDMRKLLPYMFEWTQKHISALLTHIVTLMLSCFKLAGNTPLSFGEKGAPNNAMQTEKGELRVLRIISSEQMIVSHNMGLKGKLDLVFQCEYSLPNGGIKRAIVPFELKTGEREDASHHGQTLIYCLLLMQKYKQYENINGLLFYLRKEKLLDIKPSPQQVVYLLIRRNFLAKYLRSLYNDPLKINLPPMILASDVCSHCYSNHVCSMMGLTFDTGIKRMNSRNQVFDIEEGTEVPSFKKFAEIQDIFSLSKRQYFKHWLTLIHREECHDKSLEAGSSDKESLNFVEIDNFTNFREALLDKLANPDAESQSLNIISFTRVFEEKEKCHLFLEKFKQGDQVKVTQSSLSCSIRGYINARRFTKSNKGETKTYGVTIKLKSYVNDIEVNEDQLLAMDDEDVRVLWKLDNAGKSFYSMMRGNIVDLILDEKFSNLSDLIIEEKEPRFKQLTSVEQQLLDDCTRKFELNNDQLYSLTQVDAQLVLINATFRV